MINRDMVEIAAKSLHCCVKCDGNDSPWAGQGVEGQVCWAANVAYYPSCQQREACLAELLHSPAGSRVLLIEPFKQCLMTEPRICF